MGIPIQRDSAPCPVQVKHLRDLPTMLRSHRSQPRPTSRPSSRKSPRLSSRPDVRSPPFVTPVRASTASVTSAPVVSRTPPTVVQTSSAASAPRRSGLRPNTNLDSNRDPSVRQQTKTGKRPTRPRLLSCSPTPQPFADEDNTHSHSLDESVSKSLTILPISDVENLATWILTNFLNDIDIPKLDLQFLLHDLLDLHHFDDLHELCRFTVSDYQEILGRNLYHTYRPHLLVLHTIVLWICQSLDTRIWHYMDFVDFRMDYATHQDCLDFSPPSPTPAPPPYKRSTTYPKFSIPRDPSANKRSLRSHTRDCERTYHSRPPSPSFSYRSLHEHRDWDEVRTVDSGGTSQRSVDSLNWKMHSTSISRHQEPLTDPYKPPKPEEPTEPSSGGQSSSISQSRIRVKPRAKISDKVVWDGMMKTFCHFQQLISGHLLQVGAGYLVHPDFLDNYEHQGDKYLDLLHFWTNSPLLHLKLGMTGSTCMVFLLVLTGSGEMLPWWHYKEPKMVFLHGFST